MGKKIIKTFDELFAALCEEGFNHDRSADSFNDVVQNRYERNQNIYGHRMNDFSVRENIGLNDNALKIINIGRRLDDMGELFTTDAAKTAMMFGMRDTAMEIAGNALRSTFIMTMEEMLPDVKEKYEVPAELERTYKAKARELYNKNLKDYDVFNAGFEEFPYYEQCNIASLGMRAFFDEDAFTNEENEPITMLRAHRQIFAMAAQRGAQLLRTALGEGDYKPANETETKQIERLKEICMGFTAQQKQQAVNDTYAYANPQLLSEEPVILPYTTINLKLEKNYILKDMTTESFIDKARRGALDPSEKEWGESTVERMLDQLYKPAERKMLSRAGVDPCTEIYVDRKPALDLYTGKYVEVDGHEMPETFRMRFENAQPRIEDYAEMKCAIAAAALEGKALDINKLDVNERGQVHRSEINVSVNTRNDMNREPVSLWTRILRFLGIEKDPNEKILDGNSADRHAENTEFMREHLDLNELMGEVPRRNTSVVRQTTREHTLEM